MGAGVHPHLDRARVFRRVCSLNTNTSQSVWITLVSQPHVGVHNHRPSWLLIESLELLHLTENGMGKGKVQAKGKCDCQLIVVPLLRSNSVTLKIWGKLKVSRLVLVVGLMFTVLWGAVTPHV